MQIQIKAARFKVMYMKSYFRYIIHVSLLLWYLEAGVWENLCIGRGAVISPAAGTRNCTVSRWHFWSSSCLLKEICIYVSRNRKDSKKKKKFFLQLQGEGIPEQVILLSLICSQATKHCSDVYLITLFSLRHIFY